VSGFEKQTKRSSIPSRRWYIQELLQGVMMGWKEEYERMNKEYWPRRGKIGAADKRG